MKRVSPNPASLAPLQEVMLRDSFAAPTAGYHVEQVEMILSRTFTAEEMTAAWMATVEAVEALKVTFNFTAGIPAGWQLVDFHPEPEFPVEVPGSWKSWYELDRCRRILFPGEVPWRVACWPSARRLIWTFHHALLDGRSIKRIADSFLTHLQGNPTGPLALAGWESPSAESVGIATGIFNDLKSLLDPACPEFLPENAAPGSVTWNLGADFADLLEAKAIHLKTTPATLVTWAWGQAVAEFSITSTVLVEQVRAGAPQPRTAGFTMNILPLLIRRSDESGLPRFQADLAALRQIESVSPADFPAGVYPEVDVPDVSVIMVEHETLQHALRDHDVLESITLHERIAESLMATACLRPGLFLKVEGPGREELLEQWAAGLEKIVR